MTNLSGRLTTLSLHELGYAPISLRQDKWIQSPGLHGEIGFWCHLRTDMIFQRC